MLTERNKKISRTSYSPGATFYFKKFEIPSIQGKMTEITVKILSMLDIWRTFDFLIYFLTHVHVSFVVMFQMNDLVMVIMVMVI